MVYVSLCEQTKLQGVQEAVYVNMSRKVTTRSAGGAVYVYIARRRSQSGGNRYNEHGRQKQYYKESGGAVYVSMADRYCKEMEGSVCEHGRRKSQCKVWRVLYVSMAGGRLRARSARRR
jgi:hypothetical protein